MKRQSMIFVLLLLQVLFLCIGCGSSEKAAAPEMPAATAEEAAADTEEAAVEEAVMPAEASLTEEDAVPETAIVEVVEDAIGVFEGLEDNHTAIFSFDGAETAFFFEDPAVQSVLYEAVLGSTYTLSYEYNDTMGYIIYKISEH